MQRIRPFDLVRPETVEDALSVLEAQPGSFIIAGGTDFVPKMKRGQFEPAIVVSLAGIKELTFVEKREDRLRIGALTTLRTLETHRDVSRFTSLKKALSQVATPIIRNNATLGGNLLQDTRCRYYDRSLFWRDALGNCMKLGADDCKVAPGGKRCYAAFCSDLAPALIVLDAEVKLAGKTKRTVPLDKFYLEDGMAHVSMKREILTEVIVPQNGFVSTYRKLRIRDGFDFPEVGVAVAIRRKANRVRVHVALAGIGSGVFVLKEDVAVHDLPAVADRVYNSIKPLDTLFFPPVYRKKIAKTFLLKSFDELLAS